jgi:hypothetical protein
MDRHNIKTKISYRQALEEANSLIQKKSRQANKDEER